MQTSPLVQKGTSQLVTNPTTLSETVGSTASSVKSIVPVDAGSVTELKQEALKKCLESPRQITVRLVKIAGLEFKAVNSLLREMKRSDLVQKRNLAENFLDQVFAKAKMNPEHLKKIRLVLGVNETNSSQEQDIVMVSEASSPSVPTVTKDEYIDSLRDSKLDSWREKCQHVEYNMDAGSYTYHAPMYNLYFRPTDRADYAFARHRTSGPRNRHGRVTSTSTPGCGPAHDALTNPAGTSFVNGDTIAMRRFKLLDVHASNMNSLLNSLQEKIETFGLPDDRVLAIKVAVADGYRASYVSKAQLGKEGLLWRQREVDPDNLVASDNLLSLTFKTKEDLSELISSGKTLGELASEGQVVIALKSKYADAEHKFILSQAEGLSVRPENYHDNKEKKDSCVSYFFEDGRFGKGIGGQD